MSSFFLSLKSLSGHAVTADPKQDLYGYVNRQFMETRQIPADSTSCSTWEDISDACDAELTAIISKKERIMWDCAMDSGKETHVLATLFAIADRAAAGDAFALGELHARGVNAFFYPRVEASPRAEDNDVCILRIGEGGIGLPTGWYYNEYRVAYTSHIHKVMALADLRFSTLWTLAKYAFEIEKEVCFKQMSPADSQNATLTNHVGEFESLPAGFNWAEYARGLGCESTPTVVNIEYVRSLDHAVKTLGDLRKREKVKAYLRWRCLDLIAPHMGPVWEKAQFEFYKQTLLGAKEDRALEKRRIESICALVPSAVGSAFVGVKSDEEYPINIISREAHEMNKKAASEMVRSIVSAIKKSIADSTKIPKDVKVAWKKKLRKLRCKIGFPETFPDDELAIADHAR